MTADQFREELTKRNEAIRGVLDETGAVTFMIPKADLIAKAVSKDAPRADDTPQSALEHRFDLLDGPAMFSMTNVLYHGAIKYGPNSWRSIAIEDHLNHLISHAIAYLAGNRDDNHLANVMCRAMFAHATELAGDK